MIWLKADITPGPHIKRISIMQDMDTLEVEGEIERKKERERKREIV